MRTVSVTIPVKTKNTQNASLGNSRLSGIIRAKERKAIRELVHVHVMAEVRRFRIALPVSVQITRVSAGTMDPWDGLPATLKPVVDGVADAFGLRDDDKRFTWERPAQEKCRRGFHAVRIEIRETAIGGTKGP